MVTCATERNTTMPTQPTEISFPKGSQASGLRIVKKKCNVLYLPSLFSHLIDKAKWRFLPASAVSQLLGPWIEHLIPPALETSQAQVLISS